MPENEISKPLLVCHRIVSFKKQTSFRTVAPYMKLISLFIKNV
jgi:hypothetical protein